MAYSRPFVIKVCHKAILSHNSQNGGAYMSPRIKQFILDLVGCVALFATPIVIIFIIYGLGGFQ